MPLEASQPTISLTPEALADATFRYTHVYYVNPATGSNFNDGERWDSAFRTLWAAVIAAGSLSTDFTLIVLSPDDHNVNRVDPTINKQVVIRGALHGLTSIYNDVIGATEVLKFTQNCGLEEVEIYMDGAQDGIVILSALAYFTFLESVDIDARSAIGPHDAIRIEQCNEVHLSHVHVHGDVALTTGFHLNEATLNHNDDIDMSTCLIGVHIENVASNANHFRNTVVVSCATGIQIDAGSNNHFDHIDFSDCTVNIDDNGIHTDFVGIFPEEINASVAPDNLIGVIATAGGAGVWGVAAMIRTAVAATKPFYVTGITFEISNQERFQVRLSDDGGTTYFWSSIVEERVANRTKFTVFAEFHLVRQGSAITASIRSESGGNTCTLWIHIIEV